jgi:hypothetical protein
LEEVKKEEQTTIETLFDLREVKPSNRCIPTKDLTTEQKKHFHMRKRVWREESN